MIRSLAIASLAAIALAGSAQAATFTVNATFDPVTLAPFILNVIETAPVSIDAGDTLDMTIQFLGGPVTIDGGGIWFGLLTGDPDELMVVSTLSFAGGSANLPGSIGPVEQGNAFVHLGSYFGDVANSSGAFSFMSANMVTDVVLAPFGVRTYSSAFFYYEASLQPGVVGPAMPEPATWGLMIAGFGLVGAAIRRRRSALA